MDLNARALRVYDQAWTNAELLKINVHEGPEGGGGWLDAGIAARGGLEAGLVLARVCLADLAEVSITNGEVAGVPCPILHVTTDHPVTACLASQYAGWAISVKEDKFFAMGSGPMRSAAGTEPILARVGGKRPANSVVGVLEGRKPPTAGVFRKIAEACGVPPDQVFLIVAPTASLAGGVQIIARSVETALHKLAELDYPLDRIISACGSAPIPPTAADDLAAIGRTNDAVLYGARVVLVVDDDDDRIAEVGPKTPSCSSKDHGVPFVEIFQRYGGDFYKVDPMLFSPAEIVFQNLKSGRSFRYGSVDENLLRKSFFPDINATEACTTP